MSSDAATAPPSKALVWVGRVLSGLVVLMLLASGATKFIPPNAEMVKGMEHLGWPLKLAITLGILEITCVLLYAIPQTAVLGAILLTGYMGGAIATHVRVGDNFVVQALIGVVVWLGLFMRDARLRALIPWRT